MKRTPKQILALIAIVLLVFMYVITLFCAIFDSTATMQYLKLSLVMTIAIPILLWIFGIFYRLSHPKDDFPEEEVSAEEITAGETFAEESSESQT